MTGKTRIGGDVFALAGRAGVWMLAAAAAISLGGSATLAVGGPSSRNGQPMPSLPKADAVACVNLGLALPGGVIGTSASASRAIIAGGDVSVARKVIGSEPDRMQANATGVRDDRKATPLSDVVPMILQAGMHPRDMIISTKGSQVGAMKADRQFHDRVAASGRAGVDRRRGGRVIVLGLSLG